MKTVYKLRKPFVAAILFDLITLALAKALGFVTASWLLVLGLPFIALAFAVAFVVALGLAAVFIAALIFSVLAVFVPTVAVVSTSEAN